METDATMALYWFLGPFGIAIAGAIVLACRMKGVAWGWPVFIGTCMAVLIIFAHIYSQIFIIVGFSARTENEVISGFIAPALFGLAGICGTWGFCKLIEINYRRPR